MKRKIAVLLSAMMVASAMPMTASAVELKSDSVINTGFGKVGSTIDANASNYKNYKTESELKNRKSVLKLILENTSTGDITVPNGNFTVTLENGTFGDLQAGASQTDIANAGFAYQNTGSTPVTTTINNKNYIASNVINGHVVNYATAAEYSKPGQVLDKAPTNSFIIESGKVKGFVADDGAIISLEDLKADLGKVSSDLIAKIEAVIAAMKHSSSSTDGKIKNGTTTEVSTGLKATSSGSATDAVGTELKKSYADAPSSTETLLRTIPYNIEILSPTEAKVTPSINITNDMIDNKDKATGIYVDTTAVKAGATVNNTTLSMEIFKDDNGTIKVLEDGSGDVQLNTIKGYIRLCPTTVTDPISSGLLQDDTDTKVVYATDEKPYLALPLGGVKVTGDGPVKAKVNADYNSNVIGKEFTITKGTGEGSTTLVYPTSSVKSFDESLALDQVTIRENVRQTIANGADKATFTLKLNSGFKFDNTGVNLGLTVTDASGANIIKVDSAKYISNDNQSSIQVTVSGLTKRENPIGLSIKGLKVSPVNTKNFGDVELTVSGDNIDSKTIKVAKREAIGFKLETAKQAKEIVAGRSYEKDTVNMNLQDSQTVEVKFSELVSGSLISSRSLDFNLPEGVKIVDAELSEIRNMNNLAKDDFEIINNGKTLRLKPNGYTVNSNAGKNLASFKLKFELSVAPDFAGDIKCTVTGGGQGSDAKVETVIAKAIAPFKIETKNTKINLGYQDYNTADIVITEAKPGMFLQNKEVVIGLKAPFKGGNTIGFSQASYEVSGGELEVKDKDFKVENDVIKFKVNRNSTKNPSTITIKNVKIGTNRSVPFGSYNLTVAGDAVLNNYSATKDKNGVVQVSNDDKNYNLSSLTSADKKQLANQDRTEYFEIKDYVNVVTETGTFNETVKVSVGEKTVVVGGQTLDMDVAPYIQASSNSTMVPLRFVAVALGVDSANVANPDQSSKVAWDQNSKTVTIYYGAGTGQKIIQFQAGSNVMTVDGTRIPMEYGVKAEIKEGRMFVPFRALGQALGVSVSWDPETRTAIYNAENSRNANVTTTTTKETTTATTTATTTTKKEDSTTSTTKAESTTETTTAAAKK